MVQQLGVLSTVLPTWTDYNGHFNVAYYALAFDLAADSLWAHLGISEKPVVTRSAISYAEEAHVGTPLRFEHRLMRMVNHPEGYQETISRFAMFADGGDAPIAVQERRERHLPGVPAESLVSFVEEDADPFSPRGWEDLVTQ